MNHKILTTTIVSILLTACHHDNPLTTHPKQQSAAFLMNASANVELRLQFDVKRAERGYGYVECMEGNHNPEINCDALYAGMVAFAKEGHYPGFEAITLADLAQKNVFAALSDDYIEVMASTWPNYFMNRKS
jgi:hypothetical protein